MRLSISLRYRDVRDVVLILHVLQSVVIPSSSNMSVYKLVKSIVLGKCLERLVLTTKFMISVSCISKIRFLSFRAIEWGSLSTNYDFPRHVFNKWISWSSVTSSLCCCNVSPVIAFSRGL